MPEIEIEQDGCVSIKIPMSLRRLSGRKRVISADDYKTAQESLDVVLTALARARHWRKLIDEGKFPTPEHIAQKVQLDCSYVRRILRLNNISPRIVHRLLRGEVPANLSLAMLTKPIPQLWADQERMLTF